MRDLPTLPVSPSPTTFSRVPSPRRASERELWYSVAVARTNIIPRTPGLPVAVSTPSARAEAAQPALPPDRVMQYQSPITYDSSRMHAAALYCSDGRLGEHFDDFIQNGLSLPRYDRLCLPGGPACIAGHQEAHLEEKGVLDELHFLVEVHKLKRVVLLAHQGCAFYASRLGLKEPRLELVQRADLVRAAAFVHGVTGLEAIEAYFARLVDGKVEFERVPV